MTHPDLHNLIKSYDIRGVVGTDLTPEVAHAIGAAFAREIMVPEGHRTVVVGHDMRLSAAEITTATIAGLLGQGCDVINIGLCSTDGLYHASGTLDLPGIMVTASHNPAPYNGMKMCRPGARALSAETGLVQIRERVAEYLQHGVPEGATPGQEESRNLLPAYAEFLRNLVPLTNIRPLKVVVDAGNAMAGLTVPAVLGDAAGLPPIPIEVVPLYFELDGSFPNHEANPLDTTTLRDLQAQVVATGADLGLAFDGDADRCFVIDERGEIVNPSAITALVGLREIERERALGNIPTIIYNLISSRAVPEVLQAAGARTIRCQVGHSLIKSLMARHQAVFGGEHSAHFYFRDFYFADSGMLAALHVMAALGEQPRPLSELVAEFSPYAASGEINSTVTAPTEILARLRAEFVGAEIDDLDGLTFQHWYETAPRWWFNVRLSNTEPLMRLNVEAETPAIMAEIRDRVLAIIREA